MNLIITTKICSQCCVSKPLTSFTKDTRSGRNKTGGKYGYRADCKECRRIYNKRYHTENGDKVRAQQRKWRNENITQEKDRMLQYCYGISVEQYSQMLEEQNGCCAICLNPETAMNQKTKTLRSLAVDHNHQNGQVRGLLCSNCNMAIGKFKDDISRLQNAIQYLLDTNNRLKEA